MAATTPGGAHERRAGGADVLGARPGAAPADRVRVVTAHARAAVAVLLVAAAPLVPGVARDDLRNFGLLVAFAWIPAAGVAALLATRRPGALADLVALTLDLGLVALVAVVLEPSSALLLAGVVGPVLVATYAGGRALGVLGAVVGVAIVALVGEVDRFTLAVHPVLLCLAVLLLDAVATDRWRASTGLARLDERSGAILTGIGEAVVVTDEVGRIEQLNAAAADTFGCPVEEANGRRCGDVLELLHGVRELDCSGGCAVLELGGTGVEVWRRSPTGARQPLLASASAVLDEGGALVEVVHSFRDITRLKQADEAKTLFLATASHELKTPLTVIRGFAQMLLLPGTVVGDEERQAALRAIDARAGQLSSIVDRLLMSSRIDAGRIDLTPFAVDVAPILRERADDLERATARDVELRLPDIPAAWCDPDALTTIVDHLLDNAVKYSPGGGTIHVDAAATDDAVEVSVEDQGIGMTEEQLQRCFERFWQAEATDVRRFGGTGIGLYIVRSLVEGMGGTIAVTSAPGEGSRFTVRLRRAEDVDGDDASDTGRGETSMIREYMRQLGIVDREVVT